MAAADFWRVSWSWSRLGKALFSPKPEGLDSKIEAGQTAPACPRVLVAGQNTVGKNVPDSRVNRQRCGGNRQRFSGLHPKFTLL